MIRTLHLFVWSVLFCASSVLLYAQKADISFKTEVYDFGNIKEAGGTKSCVFTFTNTGNAPLVINNVQASCGCTTPEWTKQPVQPGKTGSIKATYDPSGRPYPFDKTITVTSNATKGSVVLHIKGNVEAKVLTIEEQYPYAVGNLRLKSGAIEMSRLLTNTSKTESIEVFNNSATPIIISFEKMPAHIMLKADPISVPAKQKGTISCTFNSSKVNDFGPVSSVVTLKAGSTRGELKINATIDEDFSKLTPAELEKAPVLRAVSYNYDFSSLAKGAKTTAKFELVNDGKSDLIIRKVSSNNTNLKPSVSTLTIKPGQTGKLDVLLDAANEAAGSKYYTVLLTTNAPNQKQISLFITGEVK